MPSLRCCRCRHLPCVTHHHHPQTQPLASMESLKIRRKHPELAQEEVVSGRGSRWTSQLLQR
jgi:hypothetical protein